MKQIRELCPCADSALKTMGIALEQYQTDQRYNPGKTSVDELVSQIKQIAFGKIYLMTHIIYESYIMTHHFEIFR